MATTMIPLKDVTVSRLSMANTAVNTVGKQQPFKPQPIFIPQQQYQQQYQQQEQQAPYHQQYQQQQQTQVPTAPTRRVRRNDPYNWEWRVPAASSEQPVMPMGMADMMMNNLSPTPSLANLLPSMSMSQTVSEVMVGSPLVPAVADTNAGLDTVPTASGSTLCTVLVQFKCHHAEFSSEMELRKGQYVVVEGDRGVDIGVVIRINTEEQKQYVERTGPNGTVLRFATQREVDYWASDLKTDEAAALEYCKQRVLKHRLTMEVRHAEYQFDKKKLTFYYEAKSRVDFVTLLKELFREFSCRIWMEKVRMHE